MKNDIKKILDSRTVNEKQFVTIGGRIEKSYRTKLDAIKKAENISKDVDYIRQMIDAHYKLIKGDMS